MKIVNGHKMKFQVVEMDPDTAQLLLDKNHPDNRRPKEGRIVGYACDMLNDLWILTPEPVCQDEDGWLTNGQNRLSAVIRSGKCVPMTLVTGCSRKSIVGQDCGATRNVADVARITGQQITSCIGVAAVARAMERGIRRDVSKSMSIQRTLEYIKLHEKAIKFAYECFGGKSKAGLTQSAVKAVLARAYYKRNARERIREFGKILWDGIPDKPKADSAAIRLRNWLIDCSAPHRPSAKSSKLRASSALVYAKAEVALKHFINEENVESLRETREEFFPIPEDPNEDQIASILMSADAAKANAAAG
jgi:hypothetical protein